MNWNFVSMEMRFFIMSWGWVVLLSILNVLGVFIIKNTMEQQGTMHYYSYAAVKRYYLILFSNPQIWAAVAFIILSTSFWLLAIARMQLSLMYPASIAISVFFILILSFAYFNEPVTLNNVIACILIMTGLFLLSKS